MSRRAFVATAAVPFVAALTAYAQPAARVFRIGVLGTDIPEWRQGLREAGYVEGHNLVFEWRGADGRLERFQTLAAELVRLNVDVIIAPNPAAALAARRSTDSIPIVMVNTPDPVQLGLLREAVPGVARIAILRNPENPWHARAAKNAEAAARPLGLRLQHVEVRGPEQFEGAFAAMTRERAAAMLALSDPMTFFHRARLADLAVKTRLPSMHGVRGYADAGGLMSYWAHAADLNRRVVSYVDRILKGARPADLPVEQPTRFELVINLRTAKALGRTIPESLLQRADDVIG